MRIQPLVTAILLCVFAASGTFAKEIYKWTDENGNVHYEDKPISAQSERVAISSNPTNPAHVQAQTQARVQARIKKTEEAAAAAAAGPTAEELQAEADERAQKCAQYRATLQNFLVSRRIYREDSDGERDYMDEVEMQAARDKVEGQVEEYCSP